MQVTETLSPGTQARVRHFAAGERLGGEAQWATGGHEGEGPHQELSPGKVPVEHLRKVYGKSVMADVMQEAIASANKKIVDDNNLRLAREPKVELSNDQSAIDAALEARGDLNFKVALEVLPVFEIGDFSNLT